MFQSVPLSNVDRMRIGEFVGLQMADVATYLDTTVGCNYFRPSQRACSVYEYRPDACRSWPYIAANRTLKGATIGAAKCPGIQLTTQENTDDS